MSRAIILKPRRVISVISALFIGFYLPYHFVYQKSNGLTLYESRRCFEFEDLVQNPATLNQDDPELIDYIKEKHIFYPHFYKEFDPKVFNDTVQTTVLPSTDTDTFTGGYGQINQSAIVDRYLQHKRDGFFIEAGAFDGEYLSNSLFFEKQRNWTGLLVEPNKKAFRQLLVNGKRNASFAVNGCLSVRSYPESMTFDSADVYGGVLGVDSIPNPDMVSLRSTVKDRKFYKVQCWPVYSLLLALGNPVVDFFSLDVEGSEFNVLRTIPFDKVDIRTFAIEVAHSQVMLIRHLMKQRGYRVLKRLKTDIIFVKETD